MNQPDSKRRCTKSPRAAVAQEPRRLSFANESPAEWEALRQKWIDKLQPRDDAEAAVVLDIARSQWRIRRAHNREELLMQYAREQQFLANPSECKDEYRREAAVLADNAKALEVLHQCQMRAHDAFASGISTLKKLRAFTREIGESPTPSTPFQPLSLESTFRKHTKRTRGRVIPFE